MMKKRTLFNHHKFSPICHRQAGKIHSNADSSVAGQNVILPCKNGELKMAVDSLYLTHQVSAIHMYKTLLQACIIMKSLAEGRRVHAHMIKTGFDPGNFLQTKLVIMYAKCGSLKSARKLFDKMRDRTIASFNVLITGYARVGRIEDARRLFDKMTQRDVVSWSAMVAGYAQNGKVEEARNFFDEMPERDVVSWNAMIAGYAQKKSVEEVFKLFCGMKQAGVEPDVFTVTSLVSACCGVEGLQVQGYVIKSGFDSDVVVGNTIVSMYVSFGNMEDACLIFDKFSNRNVVSWNAMISGYVQNNKMVNAQEMFDKMPERNVFTWTIMVAGYAQNGSIEKARQLFNKMPERNIVSWTAMITGYTQSGRGDEALELFFEMQRMGTRPNEATFSSVLSACSSCASLKQGYAQHGFGKDAVRLFEEMLLIGMKPNRVTFLGVLCACRHAGHVDEGWLYFESMGRDYCIVPGPEHYACMVDLFGRAGRLDEAQDFINKMPFEPDVVVWGALLGACRMHGNMKLGERAANKMLELEPHHTGAFVLLSNIYAATGRWADVERVRTIMNDNGIKKKPGCSWIEVKNMKHGFLVGDKSHPQTEEIYKALDRLEVQMKSAGYAPDTDVVLHDVEDEQKEQLLGHHSEKLAIAFGLINTPPGTPLQIIKNLRVCGDCHSVIKLISKIVAREIVVRDTNRFHHFKDGLCSCSDYW
ncbi:pentatricopeptide repeat-containing protein At4g02750 isoform X2 [Cryptomeria japonica]|uniref:pentatricopeptide repeat-containing protein At4g02750 isoform X2 n=1 Tax=Cryptomeria japonica TaxID=3369 RepID=UPI0027DA87E0|nr:pentatricopeptide repeat-containing protein At4g02750 isoform X2 [Cryptomeria japonica]